MVSIKLFVLVFFALVFVQCHDVDGIKMEDLDFFAEDEDFIIPPVYGATYKVEKEEEKKGTTIFVIVL